MKFLTSHKDLEDTFATTFAHFQVYYCDCDLPWVACACFGMHAQPGKVCDLD